MCTVSHAQTEMKWKSKLEERERVPFSLQRLDNFIGVYYKDEGT